MYKYVHVNGIIAWQFRGGYLFSRVIAIFPEKFPEQTADAMSSTYRILWFMDLKTKALFSSYGYSEGCCNLFRILYSISSVRTNFLFNLWISLAPKCLGTTVKKEQQSIVLRIPESSHSWTSTSCTIKKFVRMHTLYVPRVWKSNLFFSYIDPGKPECLPQSYTTLSLES